MIRPITTLASIAMAGTAVLTTAAVAQVKLPPTLTMTAYDTGTAGFNITVAIGKMMKDKYSTDVRVLPAGNDVARLQPVRTGRAIAAGMGSGIYFAQEGVFEFGTKEWGPQAVQITLTTVDCNAGSLGVAADTGVKDIRRSEGQARRLRGGLPCPQPEFARCARLRRPDDERREGRRIRQLWCDVEGRHQQRRRCRVWHHHYRSSQGTGNVSARHRPGRRPRTMTRPAGRACRRSRRSSIRTRQPAAQASPRTSRSSSATTRIRSTRSTPTRRRTTST